MASSPKQSAYAIGIPPQSAALDPLDSKGHVITFASPKGGTGKTILAASTALTLLRCGKRVLVIDGDFSTRALSLLVLGRVLHTADLHVRKEECLADFFLREGSSPHEVTPRRIDRDGIEYHILFSNHSLWQSGVPDHAILSDSKLLSSDYIDGMRRLLSYLRNQYDYIIVDTRGGYDFMSAVPALLADTTIVVIEADRVSLDQVSGYERALNEFAKSREIAVPLRGFIVNKASFDPGEFHFADRLQKEFGIKTYGIIPADINCIRAYERGESPMVHFPQSDFSYYCIRAIANFVAPQINWRDRSAVEKFEGLRKDIAREWAGRKRVDRIQAAMPFLQFALILAASAAYVWYRFWPSNTALLVAYAAVVGFLLWSMVGSALSGLEHLRRYKVAKPARSALVGIATGAFALSLYILYMDVPNRLLLISLPPQAVAVGNTASDGVNGLEKQALEAANAWQRQSLEAIGGSETRVYASAERFVREIQRISSNQALSDSAQKTVATLTRRIIDEARFRVDEAAQNAISKIKQDGHKARSATDAIKQIIRNPRDQASYSFLAAANADKEVAFPTIDEILKSAESKILDPKSVDIVRTQNTSFFVCIGQYQDACGGSSNFLPCGADVTAWAQTTHPRECRSVEVRTLSSVPGNRCGYTTVEAKCSSD